MGAFSWWQDPELKGNDYLVQMDKEPGFKILRAYPIQKTFPFGKDTVYLFRRVK
jgi:hypothetical protein